MKAFLKNNILAVTLAFVVIIGFLLWIFGKEDIKDFGLNFFTEMLGVVITVVIIDKLVKDREEKRLAPLKLAEYEDALRLFSKFVSFWRDGYMMAVNEEFPDSAEDFLSEEGIGKVFMCLDLNTQPNVTPARTWWTWIPENHKKWSDDCNKYLERHSSYSDPELFKLIHGFIEGAFMTLLPMMSSIKQLDNKEGFPRLPILANYAMRPQEADYQNLRATLSTLTRIHDNLSKHFENVKSFNYQPVELSKRKITSGLTEDVLQDYRRKKEAFDQKNG